MNRQLVTLRNVKTGKTKEIVERQMAHDVPLRVGMKMNGGWIVVSWVAFD